MVIQDASELVAVLIVSGRWTGCLIGFSMVLEWLFISRFVDHGGFTGILVASAMGIERMVCSWCILLIAGSYPCN